MALYVGVTALGTKASPELTLMIAARGRSRQGGHQRRSKPDRTQQIGGDLRYGVRYITACNVLDALDAGVVDHDIDVGMAIGQFLDEPVDVGWIGQVQRQVVHAGVDAGDAFQESLAAAGNHDLIAQSVHGFGKSAANAASSAGHHDGVVCRCMS